MTDSARVEKCKRRRQRKLEREEKRARGQAAVLGDAYVEARPIKARNEAQGQYLASMAAKLVTFGVGPAGTGKTFLAAAMAADALADGACDRIVITRPAVEAEEQLGFLPGGLDEKYRPYIEPVLEVFYERLGKGPTEYMLKARKIEAVPLAYMRGRTFNDSWVLFDEAQNSTPGQMLMFLTRVGEGAKVVINGDVSQKDQDGLSGLEDALQRMSTSGHVGIVEFTWEDVVRSGFVREVLQAYRTQE